MIKKVIILILCIISINIVVQKYIESQKNEVLEDYSKVLGLTDLGGKSLVNKDLGEPLLIELYREDKKNGEIWFYDGFFITFYIDGTFRCIEITGNQYYFTKNKIHVGSSIEEVDEAYRGRDGRKYDDGKLYIDGDVAIAFTVHGQKVTKITLSYVETYH